MSKYVPNEFITALGKKMNGIQIPDCSYCGGKKFTSTDKFANIIIGEELGGINLGPNIPCGMVVCENCGHIEFFALGSLGLLKNKGE
jgi:hypothetical protein